MDVEVIRSLYDYHHWVTQRLYDEAEKLLPERTRESFGASFDTIHGTFVHLLGAEVIWLSRWIGEPRPMPPEDEFASIGDVRKRWIEQEARIEAFIDGLTPQRLDASIAYKSRDGHPYELPLWQMMLQVVNHGTHHRSELAEMLTRTGNPPAPTDLIVYYQLGK